MRKSVVIIAVLLACLLVIYAFPHKKHYHSISHKIEQIPLDDRVMIEHFWREVMFFSPGAYTVFGHKPISLASSYVLLDPREFIDFFYPQSFWGSPFFFKAGLETWKKYQHLFPMKKFIVKRAMGTEGQLFWSSIELINKDSFKQSVSLHREDFEEVLDQSNAENMLNNLQNDDVELWNLLKRHQALLGILLGFGRENAWLFHKRDRMYIDSHCYFKLCRNPAPSSGFRSVEEERDFYNQKLQAFVPEQNHCQLTFFRLPAFIADLESEETKELYKTYQADRRKISDLYSKGNFLEVTLKALTQED